MAKRDDLARVLDSGIVAILRAPSGELLADVAGALVAGGVDIVEVTFTVPRAHQVLEQIADQLGDKILLGAGTVLDTETARIAMLAGAQFIVSPVVRRDVIELCRRSVVMACSVITVFGAEVPDGSWLISWIDGLATQERGGQGYELPLLVHGGVWVSCIRLIEDRPGRAVRISGQG